MYALLRRNCRWLCWVQIFVIFAMTTASGASWQCRNGSPCALGCKMPHGIALRAPAPALPTEAHCSRCPPASASVQRSPQTSGLTCVCTTPYCVLQISDQPASFLRDRVDITPPVAVLTPQPLAAAPLEATAFAVVAPLELFPQRFLRLHSGRAPPVLL